MSGSTDPEITFPVDEWSCKHCEGDGWVEIFDDEGWHIGSRRCAHCYELQRLVSSSTTDHAFYCTGFKVYDNSNPEPGFEQHIAECDGSCFIDPRVEREIRMHEQRRLADRFFKVSQRDPRLTATQDRMVVGWVASMIRYWTPPSDDEVRIGEDGTKWAPLDEPRHEWDGDL